jgi:hypothetical protein
MKHSVDQIGGHDPWEIEIAYYVEKLELTPEEAHFLTIVRWMHWADLRALRAALAEASAIDDKKAALDKALLQHLIDMIDQGRLVMKLPRGRRRPKSPEKFARDLVGALLYERAEGKSATAFTEVAQSLGMGENALRDAVTSFRNARKANAD